MYASIYGQLGPYFRRGDTNARYKHDHNFAKYTQTITGYCMKDFHTPEAYRGQLQYFVFVHIYIARELAYQISNAI